MEKQEESVIETCEKAVANPHLYYNKCNMGGGI